MKEITGKTLSIYWRHAKKYKALIMATLVLVIINSLAAVIAPLYLKNFFNLLAAGGTAGIKDLVIILLSLALFYLIGELSREGRDFLTNRFQPYTMADLASTCFACLHKHSYGFFSNNFVGSIAKRVNRFIRGFEEVADIIVFNFAALFFNTVFTIGILFTINTIFAVWIIGFIAVYIVINLFFIKIRRPIIAKRNDFDSRCGGFLADTITNNVAVKLFNAYGRELKDYSRLETNLALYRKKSWDIRVALETIQGLLAVVTEVGILYYAIVLWKNKILTVGDFILLQSYFILTINMIWNIGQNLRRFDESLSDASEMTQILETPLEVTEVVKAEPLGLTAGNIVFKDVSFSFHDTRTIFKNFNLDIRGKEKVALVGPSGSGKSTFVKLLLRMYDVTGGNIFIDGQEIAKVTMESLWKSMAMVPQDSVLFHRSLKDNIRYGKPRASDSEVVRAAKLAHCHEFISQLQDGYDTFVGERGIKLSGGERQRVAIARAILYDAPILILDEATSSLDSESERLIQDALDNLIRGKTVIVIAHRLSTIMKMDRIVVLEKGRIVEGGSHMELLQNKQGLYHKLWTVQAGGFIS